MKHKWLSLFVLALPLCSCSLSKSTSARALTKDENVVVELGDKIEVENRSLVYEGQTKAVEGQIILPDGSSKKGSSFTISMPGVYIVNYRAFFGTVEVSESIYYNCYRKSGDLFISSESKNQPQNGEYSFNLKNKKAQGAKLSLDSRTKFTYDGIIDFNSFSFDQPFLEFIVDTSKQDNSDLEAFTVRLTDVENSNNYVEMLITDSGPVDDDGKGCYIRAGANNQFKSGYEGDRLHIVNYGTNVASSFRALPTENPVRTAQLFLNYPQRAFYVYPTYGSLIKSMITDLDDKEIYGSSIWEGFKTGKATLSIFATSLNSSNANLIVTKVAGIDLSQMVFEDHSAPEIQIDYDGQLPANLPKATLNKPYKIFDADIVDNFDRNLTYSTYVTYQDKENHKNKDVTVTNGYFIPKQVGNYVITYVSKDYSNNEAKKTVTISSIEDEQTISTSLEVTSISELLYTPIELPSTDDLVVTGGSGKAKKSRMLVDSSNQEIEIEGNTFIPTKVGTYKAHYTAVDYLGQSHTSTITINVEKPDKPIFIGDLFLPRVLIKDHKYTLPPYQAVEVINSETVYLYSKVYVNDTLSQDNTFTATGTSCAISYRVTGQTGEEVYNTNINVIDTNGSKKQNEYFVGDFDTKEIKEFGVSLTTDHDASAYFASVLPYDNPFVRFEIPKDHKNFNKLTIKFSDHKNPNISLTFVLDFIDDQTFITTDDQTIEYNKTSSEDMETYVVSVNNNTKSLVDINDKEIAVIHHDDKGNPFDGFVNGVYLDIEMEGVSGDSTINIVSIANQAFGTLGLGVDYDIGAPIIIFNKKFVTEQSYGEMAYVPSVEVFDVLSDVNVKMTVTGPDGKERISNEDATIDRSFKLDSFGSYLVTYKAKDSAGNSVSYPRKITVYDYIAPEINITGSLSATYSIGSPVSIPTYTVTDNRNDYTLDVFLIMPNDEERLLLIDKNGKITSYLSKDNNIYDDSFK